MIMNFRKSSHSLSNNQCIMVASDGIGHVAVADSQSFGTGYMLFPAATWREFVNGIARER